MAMVEPFLSVHDGGRVRNLLDPDSTIKSIHIAQGLGASSAYTWMKLPVVDDLERVMDATTMPTLLLGGDPTGDPEDTYASWGKALALPPVRGLVVGRALLFPPDGDVAAAVDIAGRARARGRVTMRTNEWVLPSGTASRDGFDVVVDDAVQGWTHTGLRIATLAADESVHVPGGGVGVRRRSPVRVGPRLRAARRRDRPDRRARRSKLGVRRAHRRRLRPAGSG